MKFKNLFFGLTTLSLIASCGSDSSGTGSAGSSLTSGSFIDNPVQGLEYSSTSGSGVTSSSGGFDCKSGESVTFKINDVEIGSTNCDEVITPLDVLGATDYTDTKAINLAYLLQAMDSDSDVSNGINITSSKSSITSLDFTDDSQIDTLVSGMPNKDNVSRDSAKAHAMNFEGNIGDYKVTSLLGCFQPSDTNYAGDCPSESDFTFSFKFDGKNLTLSGAGDGYETSHTSLRDAHTNVITLESSTYVLKIGGKTNTNNTVTGLHSLSTGAAVYFKDKEESSSSVCSLVNQTYVGHFIRVSDMNLDATALEGEAAIAYTVTCKNDSGQFSDYDEFVQQTKVTKQFSLKF